MTHVRDLGATLVTALVVLTFAATHEGWDVWLVGSSHRWAAGAILLLGMVGCGLGSPGKDSLWRLFAGLGTVTLALAIAALVTGSLTVLSLLVAAIVLLWAGSTIRHTVRLPHAPHPA